MDLCADKGVTPSNHVRALPDSDVPANHKPYKNASVHKVYNHNLSHSDDLLIQSSSTSRNSLKEEEKIKNHAPSPNTASPRLVLSMSVHLQETYQNITQLQKENPVVQKPKPVDNNIYQVKRGEILGPENRPSLRFRVLDFLGQGSFGQVVKVQKLDPSEHEPEFYAIKIIKKSAPFLNQGRREVELLNWVKQRGGENGSSFIVRFIEDFMFAGHLCLVFELLSTSLLDLVNLSIEAAQPGLSLRMVHKFAHQLLSVLYTLGKINIIHCDIKPENIALTSPHMAHIKVLDFGSSCHAQEPVCNMFPYIQSRFYRSPEVLLGCRYSYPIDMWSLGCVLVELYTARPLFAGRDKVDQLYTILDMLGWPSRTLLDASVHYKVFFKHVDGKTLPRREYSWNNWPKGVVPLWDRINSKNEQPSDLCGFYDLISQMLIYEPTKRITPEEALNHPFILNGPASRNRTATTKQEVPIPPMEQKKPEYIVPPWGFPGTTTLKVKTPDVVVQHDSVQRLRRLQYFRGLKVTLPSRTPPTAQGPPPKAINIVQSAETSHNEDPKRTREEPRPNSPTSLRYIDLHNEQNEKRLQRKKPPSTVASQILSRAAGAQLPSTPIPEVQTGGRQTPIIQSPDPSLPSIRESKSRKSHSSKKQTNSTPHSKEENSSLSSSGGDIPSLSSSTDTPLPSSRDNRSSLSNSRERGESKTHQQQPNSSQTPQHAAAPTVRSPRDHGHVSLTNNPNNIPAIQINQPTKPPSIWIEEPQNLEGGLGLKQSKSNRKNSKSDQRKKTSTNS